MRLHRVSDIFENKPEQWGLRGDENYWKYLYSYYNNNPDIDSYLHDISIDKFYIDIANVYKKLFNDELFSDNKFHNIAKKDINHQSHDKHETDHL